MAKAADIDPNSVTWVNVQPNAKIASLKSDSIHVTTSFYNIHFIFQRVFGDDMGFLALRDIGINPYGNSVIANGAFLKEKPEVVKAFVQVTQKAYHACVADPDPCIDALIEANSGLKRPDSVANWQLVEELMSDKNSRSVALGHFDPARMQDDYKLIETYFSLEKPFDITDAYSNDFLDMSLKMTRPPTEVCLMGGRVGERDGSSAISIEITPPPGQRAHAYNSAAAPGLRPLFFPFRVNHRKRERIAGRFTLLSSTKKKIDAAIS